MKNCKYVVLSDDKKYGTEKIFIFDASINHKDFARGMIRGVRMPIVVSAGFISEFLTCYGESITLSVRSRPDMDTLLLHSMLEFEDKEIKFK